MENGLELIKKNIAIIEQMGINTSYLNYVDARGNFKGEMPQMSEEYYRYEGKIMGDGALYIVSKSVDAGGMDEGYLPIECHETLVGYNLEGQNFEAGYKYIINAYSNNKEKEQEYENRINNLASNYKAIIKALNSNVDEEYLKQELGVDIFTLNNPSKTR